MALLDDLLATLQQAGSTPWAQAQMHNMTNPGPPISEDDVIRMLGQRQRTAPLGVGVPAPSSVGAPNAAPVQTASAAPAPARERLPAPETEPTAPAAPKRPDLSPSGPSGGEIIGAILQGVGGVAAPIGNLVAQTGAQGRQTETRNQTYDWLISKGVDPQEAQLAVTNPAIGKDVLTRVLGTGKPMAETATKGLPQGYIWNDPNNPGKGARRVEGVAVDPSKELTPAQKSLDQKFARDYSEFMTGGFADVEKGLGQLRGVLSELKERKLNLTGPILGQVPDKLTAFTHPEAIDRRELVEEVVQRNLRAVLGAQFTEREGERLIARAYNPKLDEAENAKRLERLISSIEKAYKAKVAAARHFEKHGTLSNYTGSTAFGLEDIERGMEGGGSRKSAVQSGDPLERARAAIASGASREAVIRRLREHGIEPTGL